MADETNYFTNIHTPDSILTRPSSPEADNARVIIDVSGDPEPLLQELKESLIDPTQAALQYLRMAELYTTLCENEFPPNLNPQKIPSEILLFNDHLFNEALRNHPNDTLQQRKEMLTRTSSSYFPKQLVQGIFEPANIQLKTDILIELANLLRKDYLIRSALPRTTHTNTDTRIYTFQDERLETITYNEANLSRVIQNFEEILQIRLDSEDLRNRLARKEKGVPDYDIYIMLLRMKHDLKDPRLHGITFTNHQIWKVLYERTNPNIFMTGIYNGKYDVAELYKLAVEARRTLEYLVKVGEVLPDDDSPPNNPNDNNLNYA